MPFKTSQRSFLIFACIALFACGTAACEQHKYKEAEEAEKPPELADPTGAADIIIVVHQPEKHAHRGDSTYRLTPLTDGNYAMGKKIRIQGKLVQPLIDAASQDLIPSDNLKSCKPSKDNIGFTITIPTKEHGTLTLTSTADCANWAPWNVVKDGKLYVQLSGKIGAPLPDLGYQLEQVLWEGMSKPKTGRIDLTAKGTVPEGVEAQTLPMGELQEKLLAHDTYKANFKKLTPTEMRLLCSQKRSADCSTLLGQAISPIKKGYTLTLEFDTNLKEITTVHWPENKKLFDTFLKSKPVSLMVGYRPKGIEEPVRLTYSGPGECRFMQAGISEIKPEANAEKCSYFSAILEFPIPKAKEGEKPTLLPPRQYYYPELGAISLQNWSVGTEIDFYKKLKSKKVDIADIENDIRYDKYHFYTKLDGTLVKVRK